jgi:uncharacterized glyoxalase superfamily protein PhnB
MGKILLKNVMLGFPALAEPQSFGEGDPAYGAKLPIDPSSENLKLIEAEIKAVATEQWKDKADAILDMLRDDNKMCLVRKEYRSKTTQEVYEGFQNSFMLSTRNPKTQPSVFDEYGNQLEKKSDIERKAFSGAIAAGVSVEIWAQDNKWGKRVNCTLLGVMLSGEGNSIGGGSAPATADDFASLAKAKSDAEDIL